MMLQHFRMAGNLPDDAKFSLKGAYTTDKASDALEDAYVILVSGDETKAYALTQYALPVTMQQKLPFPDGFPRLAWKARPGIFTFLSMGRFMKADIPSRYKRFAQNMNYLQIISESMLISD